MACDRLRDENPFRYAIWSLMVDQMAVSDTHRRKSDRRAADEQDPSGGRAARSAAPRIELHVYTDNGDARRFYEAHGFVRFQDVMESTV